MRGYSKPRRYLDDWIYVEGGGKQTHIHTTAHGAGTAVDVVRGYASLAVRRTPCPPRIDTVVVAVLPAAPVCGDGRRGGDGYG